MLICLIWGNEKFELSQAVERDTVVVFSHSFDLGSLQISLSKRLPDHSKFHSSEVLLFMFPLTLPPPFSPGRFWKS